MTMSKQTHTPGPWQKESDGAGEFGIHADAGRTWKFVAMVTANGQGSAVVTEAEAEANARLVAAAPELLAACELALAYMERHSVPAPEYVTARANDLNILRAAIAKAGGR